MPAMQQLNPGLMQQPYCNDSTTTHTELNGLVRTGTDGTDAATNLYQPVVNKMFGCVGSAPNSAGMASLLIAFRATGGVVRGDELAMMLEELKMGDMASLGRAMATGEICSFQWRSAFWIPMFQFQLHNLSFKRECRQLIREFKGVFEGWMLAAWFAQPNSWLNGQRPVDLLVDDLPAVVEAARSDRFVAVGQVG